MNNQSNNQPKYFYIDYFGFSVISNGKRFRSTEIKSIQHQAEAPTYSYEIETNTGESGILTILPTDANFKVAKDFVSRCLRHQ